ncbi:hypothetical protein ACFQQB_09060 [Nonomuraea rubra]
MRQAPRSALAWKAEFAATANSSSAVATATAASVSQVPSSPCGRRP